MSQKDTNLIDTLQKKFNESVELNKESTDEFDEHKQYYHGDQLPDDVLATLRARSQPVHWENLYQKIGNKIMGFKISTRKEIRVLGRQRDDKNVANLLTDIFRTISDDKSFNAQLKQCDVDLLLGLGVFEVGVKDTGEKDDLGKSVKEVYIEHIPSECFRVDPFSVKYDASDATHFHKELYIDREELELAFGVAKLNSVVFTKNAFSDRERARVVESWYRVIEGGRRVWKRTFWSDYTELKTEKSPYAHGRHPFAIRKLFIDNTKDNNNFYGMFRNVKPIQDSVNFAILRVQNMLGSNKTIIEEDAVDDVDSFIEEYNKDDSVNVVRSGAIMNGKIQHVKHNAEIAQLGNLLVDYRKSATDIIGVSDELLGAATNRMSGYAIEQRQNVGLVGLQQFMDASDELLVQAFTLALSLVQQYYTAEQVFKIIEKESFERYFVINEYERAEHGEVARDTQGKPKVKNRIDVGRYDVILKTIPATQGSMAERYKMNTELLKTVAQAEPELLKPMLPLLLRDSQSTIADDVLEMIHNMAKQGESKEAAQAKEMQMQQIKLTMDKMSAEIALLKAKSVKTVAEANEEAGRVRGA